MGSSVLSDTPNTREKEVGAVLTMAVEPHEKATGPELKRRKGE